MRRIKNNALIGLIILGSLSSTAFAESRFNLNDRMANMDRGSRYGECAAIAQTCSAQAQTCKETAMAIWEGLRACIEIAQENETAVQDCRMTAHAQIDEVKLCFSEIMECRSQVRTCMQNPAQ